MTSELPSLSGKGCIVTGASRGIGKGIALILAKAGATVYITGQFGYQKIVLWFTILGTFLFSILLPQSSSLINLL